jgi:hypothetical protein
MDLLASRVWNEPNRSPHRPHIQSDRLLFASTRQRLTNTFLFVGGNSSLDPYGVAAHVSRRGREGHVLLALNAYERSKDSPWGSVAVCVRRFSAVVSVAEQSEAS